LKTLDSAAHQQWINQAVQKSMRILAHY